MELEFAGDTDRDTFDRIFGGLVGYVIDIGWLNFEPVAMQLEDTRHPEDGTPGLYGHAWDDEFADADLTEPVFVPWEHITKVVIW